MGCDMWFGTKEYSRWVSTPQTGADVSSSAWSEDGGFLNGAGYALNSRGSHKRYVFSWGSSNARHTAQLFKSYFDGSFGRGKLYLIDPLTTSTNVLPARWADPSIGLDYESPSLVPGVVPTRSSASGFERLQLPVASASYSLTGSPAQTVSKETVVENLFTNPRLKGDGTWAEVRRNLLTRPNLSAGTAGWSLGSGVTVSPGADYADITAASLGAGSAILWAVAGARVPVTPGELLCLAGRFSSDSAISVSMEVTWYAGNTISGQEKVVFTPSDARETQLLSDAVAPTGVDSARFTIRAESGISSSDTLRVWDGLSISKTRVYEGALSGSTVPEVEQPEDFRVRWLGTPNASESVMEIERVRGLTAVNCVAGVSTKDGKPAMRLIATGSSTDSFASLVVPEVARARGTLLGHIHTLQDAVPPLSSNRRSLRAIEPNFVTLAPLEAGSYPLRLAFGPTSVGHQARWYHGGAQGSGDVWWTDIGLYAGDYDGPNFTGADGTVRVNGETLATEWVGTPDDSVSRAVRFKTSGTPRITENNSLFIPIPDGHQLNLGAFYSSTGGGGIWAVSATTGGGIGGIIAPLTKLDGTSSNLFPDVITKPPGTIGAYIWIGSVGSSSGSSVTINAMHARISPVGQPPKGENMWIGGQGNEGVRFAGPPTYINVNGRDGGRIEFAATFVESVL